MRANKKVCLALTTAFAIISAAAFGYAQRIPERLDKRPQPPAPIEKPPVGPEVAGFSKQTSGEILSANPVARVLVIVTEDRKQMTFFVSHEAALQMDQFKPGDSVTVRYTEGGGRFIAQAVSRG